jgi:tetratricopeptide (TPR) repeat protein
MARTMKMKLAWLCCMALAGCSSAPARHAAKLDSILQTQQQADQAYTSGDMAGSIALYQKLTEAVPQEADYWYRLGNAYARLQQPDQAVDAYQQAIKRNGAHARAWHNLAIVRMRQAQAALIVSVSSAAKDDPIRAQSDQLLKALEKAGPATAVDARLPALVGRSPIVVKQPEEPATPVEVPVNSTDTIPVDVLDGNGHKLEAPTGTTKTASQVSTAPAKSP